MPAAAVVLTVGPVQTHVAEVADGIFQLTTPTNKRRPVISYLVDAEEPLLFGAGTRHTVAGSAAALATVIPLERLRWLSSSHLAAVEPGVVSRWIEHVPGLTVVHTAPAGALPLGDVAGRTPLALAPDTPMELGGRRVRLLPTPPIAGDHAAIVLFEEVTATLCAGLVELAAFGQLTGAAPTILQRLAELRPTTLAGSRGAPFHGDAAALLRGWACGFEAPGD
jgi:hypothetical protein